MADPESNEPEAADASEPPEAPEPTDEAPGGAEALEPAPGVEPLPTPEPSPDAAAAGGDPFSDEGGDPVAAEDEGLPPEFMAGLSRNRGWWYLIAAAAGVALVAAVAAYFWPADEESRRPRRPLVPLPHVHPRPPSADASAAPKPAAPTAGTSAPAPGGEGAYSLRLLEEAFAEGEYTAAMDQASRLVSAMDAESPKDVLTDFVRLRYAQCCQRTARFEEATAGLSAAAESPSPLVRGLALAERARGGLASGQYLNARMYAYQAMAAVGALPQAGPLATACDFLAAEALTHKVLTFHGAARLLPKADVAVPDPVASAETTEAVRALLAAGMARFRQAAAGVRATSPNGTGGAVNRWSVTSQAAPLDAILHRVAAPSALDVAWADVDPSARRRPVRLDLSQASDTRVIEVACGAAGLVARLTGEEAVIHDPRTERSAAALQALLAKEAVSMWRRRLLDERDDPGHERAHFALALIAEYQGDTASAIAEYALLARRYEMSPLAPVALLRSAGIAIDLRDYAGARRRLLQLLNRDPDYPDADAVYLRLGHATLQAGLYENAADTYRRLYYWELSREAQAGGAFGAGKAYHLLGRHDEAVKWLERYRLVARGMPHADRAEAEYRLGASLLALAEPDRGQAALRRARAADPAQPLRADVTLTLAESLGDTSAYPEALALVARVPDEGAPAAKVDEAVLLEARLLRRMGLADRAVRALARQRDEASSEEATVRIDMELAHCYVALDQPDEARRLLDVAVARLEPGPIAQAATADLAELHLADGRTRQAATLARSLLARSPGETIRRRALGILGRAYLAAQDYERAALAFSGKVPEAEEGATP